MLIAFLSSFVIIIAVLETVLQLFDCVSKLFHIDVFFQKHSSIFKPIDKFLNDVVLFTILAFLNFFCCFSNFLAFYKCLYKVFYDSAFCTGLQNN